MEPNCQEFTSVGQVQKEVRMEDSVKKPQYIIDNNILTFLENCSGSAFVACDYIAKVLRENGFVEVKEHELWNLERGKKYYLIRDNLTLFTFAIGGKYEVGNGFVVAGSHIDHPSLKLKPNAFKQSQELDLVGVETYGGLTVPTWYDRDLGISGRVIVEEDGKFRSIPISIKEPLYRISTCAPHLDKRYLKGMVMNRETELPAMGLNEEELMTLIKEKIGECNIVEKDLYLVDVQKPTYLGLNNEFLSAQGLDDLICAYGGLYGFLDAVNEEELANNPNVIMSCFYDVEEIGSANRRGAKSVMLPDILERICSCFCENMSTFIQKKQIDNGNTIILSIDVTHANHPLYGGAEKNHPVRMNRGLCAEVNCRQTVCSDTNLFNNIRQICKRIGTDLQIYMKKQDSNGGGSTIGPRIASMTSYNVFDFGVAMLAMHSAREICGSQDAITLRKLIREIMNHYHEFSNYC